MPGLSSRALACQNYAGSRQETAGELDPERVIYMGTFSKTLAPALRTAFIVAPWPAVRCVREAKWQVALHAAQPKRWAGCIGFGHLSEERIDRGVAILARTLHSTAGFTLTRSTP